MQPEVTVANQSRNKTPCRGITKVQWHHLHLQMGQHADSSAPNRSDRHDGWPETALRVWWKEAGSMVTIEMTTKTFSKALTGKGGWPTINRTLSFVSH